MSANEPIRINGLCAFAEKVAWALWRARLRTADGIAALGPIRDSVRDTIAQVDRLAARHENRVAWRDRTRDAYAFLRFIDDPAQLERHFLALDRARRAALEVSEKLGPSTVILLGITQSVWRARRTGSDVVVQCHEALVTAPDPVWRAMLGQIIGRTHPVRRRTLNEFIESAPYLEVAQALADLCPLDPSLARGRTYDLDLAFDRVNALYFDGGLAKPALRFSKSLNRSTWGTYQASRDLVTISRVLDDPAVPEYVIDFILYHELLHKVHGVAQKDDRRAVHTREFRADERRFQRFADASRFLERLGGTASRDESF